MSDDWSVDELVAELRARERRGSPPAAAAPSAAGVAPRFRRIGELSSAELIRLANARQRAVYGVDDRKEVEDVADLRARALADACAALVEAADLSPAPGGFTLRTSSYQADYNLCAGEPFAGQPRGCFCSGVLVGADVVATAGHCVKSSADLARIRFVFGFRIVNGAAARTEFGADDVYAGRELIGRKLTDDAADWALVRLERPVVGRAPAAFRRSGSVPDGEPLFVIGHPCGLPQKFADGAHVRGNAHAAYFVANLDTYGGNSGSPVFSPNSYTVEGLLVRGQKDFVSNGSCNVSFVFPTTGPEGEHVSRTTEWEGLLE